MFIDEPLESNQLLYYLGVVDSFVFLDTIIGCRPSRVVSEPECNKPAKTKLGLKELYQQQKQFEKLVVVVGTPHIRVKFGHSLIVKLP